MSNPPALDRLLGRLAAWLLRGLAATWRVRFEGADPLRDPVGPVLAAFWHRDLFMAAWIFRDRGIAVPVSRSRDGDRVSALLVALGFAPPARGSSSRGGAAALRGIARQLAAGGAAAVTADGPRGPARHLKPGVILLAALAEVPVVPLSLSCRPALRFRSWDGTRLPLPFARVVCRYGEPFPVTSSDEVDADARERATRELEKLLNQQSSELDESLGVV